MLPILPHMIMGRLFLGESAPSHLREKEHVPFFPPKWKDAVNKLEGLSLVSQRQRTNSTSASQMSRAPRKPGPPARRCLWSKVCFRDSENQPEIVSKQHTRRKWALFPGQGNRQQALLFSRGWTVIVPIPTKPPCVWSSQGHLWILLSRGWEASPRICVCEHQLLVSGAHLSGPVELTE